MCWAAAPQCLGLVMGITLGAALLISPLEPAMGTHVQDEQLCSARGMQHTWPSGCRVGNTMTASLHSLCADILGPHSHPPVTQNDANQSKFSPRGKRAAPGQEGGLSSRVLLTKVGMAMGRRCKGKQKHSPSPVGSPGAFWRIEEAWVAAEGVTHLSASGTETPAAFRAEELSAECQRSPTGNQLAVKGTRQRRAAGIPQEMPLLPPWALGMLLWTAFPGVETSLCQKCSPEAGDPELEG